MGAHFIFSANNTTLFALSLEMLPLIPRFHVKIMLHAKPYTVYYHQNALI